MHGIPWRRASHLHPRNSLWLEAEGLCRPVIQLRGSNPHATLPRIDPVVNCTLDKRTRRCRDDHMGSRCGGLGQDLSWLAARRNPLSPGAFWLVVASWAGTRWPVTSAEDNPERTSIVKGPNRERLGQRGCVGILTLTLLVGQLKGQLA